MNGPDHYREAEKLLTGAANVPVDDRAYTMELIAVAQVHATLALAAATATQLTGQFVELDEDAFAWNEVAGVPLRGVEDVHLPEVHT